LARKWFATVYTGPRINTSVIPHHCCRRARKKFTSSKKGGDQDQRNKKGKTWNIPQRKERLEDIKIWSKIKTTTWLKEKMPGIS